MELDERDRWLQERYARWLDRCTKIAFVVTLCAFLAYVLGLLPARVPLADVPAYWNLPLAEYLERTGGPTGWQWLSLIGYGDYLNYAGIGLFALVVLVCHGAMIVPMLRRGERLLAALSLAQCAVLLAAASGLLAGG